MKLNTDSFLTATVLAIAVGAVVYMSHEVAESKTRQVYGRAQEYAIKCIGDRKGPMTNVERDKWYSLMNVDKNDKPSIKDLEHFIQKVQDNLFIDGKMPHWPTSEALK